MTTILKVCGVAIILALIFLISGWAANLVLSYTGCIWTSSSVFGFSFLAMGVAVTQLSFYISDALNLF